MSEFQVFVPTVVEKTATGSRSMDIYSRLLSERIIMLGTPIDATVANLIVAQLLHLEAEDPGKDISMYINSPGGDVLGLMAMYDTMQFIKCDVATICMGQAASAAAVMLAAGTPGKRFCLPNSRVLIHQPMGGARGQAADIQIQAAEIQRLRGTLDGILSHHTGQPIDKINADTDRDRILTATEALEYGLIDAVIDRR